MVPRILVLLALGWLIFNVKLFGDLVGLFASVAMYVGMIIWKTLEAGFTNDPQDKEALMFMCFVLIFGVGLFKMRKFGTLKGRVQAF